MIFVNKESSKTNELHKFFLNLSRRLDRRSLNEHVAFQNMSDYYTCKNIRKQYKNEKFKIKALILNDEFELLDGSYSVPYTKDYIDYNKTLSTKH